jgi:hypothetical protein
LVGEVVEKGKETIKIRIRLGVLSFPLSEVKSIEPVHDPKSEYGERLAKLDKTSVAAQLALGRWAMDQGMLKEAQERFQAAAKLAPDDERAALLLRQVTARLDKAGNGTREPSTPAGAGGASKLPVEEKSLLTAEDMSRIRLDELRENEAVTVDFRNDVVDRFIQAMEGLYEFRQPGFARRFRGYAKARQARYMIKHLDRASTLKDDIIIRSDPKFMKDFRRHVWAYVVRGCAASHCHGAKKGRGGLKLFNVVSRDERVDYTNFLILDSYYNKRGLRMIDRDDPETSLLLQYALPTAQAEYKHSKKVSAALSGRTSSAYRQALQWVRDLEGPPHPQYSIRRRPPFVKKPPPGLPGIRTGSPTTKATKRDRPF